MYPGFPNSDIRAFQGSAVFCMGDFGIKKQNTFSGQVPNWQTPYVLVVLFENKLTLSFRKITKHCQNFELEF